jgi:hypothetical protein
MIPNELAEQVRLEIKRLKDVQDDFLQTYKRVCLHHGGPDGLRKESEVVFHQVRADVIPLMEQLGMDRQSVQALCSWAENLLTRR